MNWDVMSRVVMSGIFFAPMLIALGFFLVIGVLVVFEALVNVAGKQAAGAPRASDKTAVSGPIVARLQESIQEEATAKSGEGDKKASQE